MENTITQTEKENLERANEILDLLSEGKFIDAMKTYLADNVQLFEGNNLPKIGKEHCILEEQKLLDTVVEFNGYKVLSGPAAKGDTTFYEAIMEFKTNDGTVHKFEQSVRTKWKDGKITNERYYHA